MSSRTRLAATGGALATWPAVALAEVLDKEAVPWSPSRVLSTLLAIGICVLLMVWARRLQSSWRWALVLAATGLALFWAAAAAFDDFYSADVGPAMRAELGDLAKMYAALLPLESAAPILAVVTLGFRLVRTQRQKLP
jgi:hypothetical protein